MTPRDFCYWLQGFFELDESDSLSEEQVKQIKSKLDSMFLHEANQVKPDKPSFTPPFDSTVYRC